MAGSAIRLALEDAGIEPEAIECGFFANSTQGHFDGQHALRGPIVFRDAGLAGIFATSVENACAGGMTAFYLAVQAVRSGACEIAIAVGSEKLTHPDKAKSFAAFESGVDLGDPEALERGLTELSGQETVSRPDGARSRMMDIYAAMGAYYSHRYSSSPRHLAAIAHKNREVGALNPLAAIRKPLTVEEILGGKPVVGELTVPMCAPLTDGAAAVVVARNSAMRRAGHDAVVRAVEVRTGAPRSVSDLDRHIVRRTAKAAYLAAGIGPQDIDFAEVHDATVVGELWQSELLGFCLSGTGWQWASSGASALGGAQPINLSGGLISKGHPLGATGLSQICEIVWQMRGLAGGRQHHRTRLGLAENGGGFFSIEEAVCGVSILEAI